MSEPSFQDALRDLFRSIIVKFKFDGVEFSRVERDYPLVDSRELDLVIFSKPGDMPFLVIETKRKINQPHARTRELFEPLGKAVEILIERRITGSKEENREHVKGEEEMKVKSPRKVRAVKNENTLSLDVFSKDLEAE